MGVPLLNRGRLQAIAHEVGYADLAFVRGLFKRATGMTSAEYRAQSGPKAAAYVA